MDNIYSDFELHDHIIYYETNDTHVLECDECGVIFNVNSYYRIIWYVTQPIINHMELIQLMQIQDQLIYYSGK